MMLIQPIAITMGDAAGIGPELIAKLFRNEQGNMSPSHRCFVAGDVQTMRWASGLVSARGQLPLPVARISDPQDALAVPPGCIPVLQIGEPLEAIVRGQVSAVAGEFAGRCVVWAAEAALRNQVGAVVTAPLHKESISAAGAPYSAYPGHTELLQACAASHTGKTTQELPVRMMLANDELRTVLVSIHVSLRDAIDAVTYRNVLETIEISHHSLSKVLGHPPRIAVAGLNPHAGEGGLFGLEEVQVLLPAIRAAQALGIQVEGPFAPDTVFMRARAKAGKEGRWDVVIAMYHDQGLIPVKYLGVEHGVNVTLGLPFVRTSPDHGTAFDIAGTGQADPASLRAAVTMAKSMLI
ncbi:4-hydroxythreonine-4-phosphate dehydrogenase PdxA [Rhodoferax aquaticus]|uniref:4-hydroxythreonine-4-phosphate dehydrogenase PdxA n=1 Tax=Rhodoferax aquaticus TaxID=2527691 RepID=A0A515ESI2_9BURK|nr:4-hydroxythreonine-4-phosphate dehydrogenase PdxA [Rhodoferax aquaticus]QDL55626.1 4-hydroxythreonine-4-phosphate dehydrogenase PdxA [Rhodoferax aquaticus]